VARLSKEWVYGLSLAGIAVSNPSGSWNVVCCEVKFSAAGRSLVQRSSTESGVSECGRDDDEVALTVMDSCAKEKISWESALV
jgi:hypothetical protein